MSLKAGEEERVGERVEKPLTPSSQPLAVERVSTKLPNFWEEVPEVWFAQAEAEFEISNITRERTQYSYLVAALSKEVLAKVLDIVKNPDREKPYSHLKETILRRLTCSEEARLSNLLYHVEMGDKCPSEFYRHMLQIAGDSTDLSLTLVQKLWKSRLPKSIEVALVAVDSKDHAELVRIADRLWECTQSGAISEVTSGLNSSRGSVTEELRREISEIRDLIKNLGKDSHQPRQSRWRNRSASRNRNNPRQKTPLRQRKPFCWYHYRFGNEANKCVEPCNFSSSRGASTNDQKN